MAAVDGRFGRGTAQATLVWLIPHQIGGAVGAAYLSVLINSDIVCEEQKNAQG